MADQGMTPEERARELAYRPADEIAEGMRAATAELQAKVEAAERELAEAKALAAEGRAAGRAEAAEILMAQSAEEWATCDKAEELTDSREAGDSGEHSWFWVPEKVRAFFDAPTDGGVIASLLERADGGYWEAVAHQEAAEARATAAESALAEARLALDCAKGAHFRAQLEHEERAHALAEARAERDQWKRNASAAMDAGTDIPERIEMETLLECISDVATGRRPISDFMLASGVLGEVVQLRFDMELAESERDAACEAAALARAGGEVPAAEGPKLLRSACGCVVDEFGQHIRRCTEHEFAIPAPAAPGAGEQRQELVVGMYRATAPAPKDPEKGR